MEQGSENGTQMAENQEISKMIFMNYLKSLLWFC